MSDARLQPRGSGTAVWKQIEQELLQEIAHGKYAPGDRLPSESLLAAHFAVNRHTVRRALSELSAQRLISIENGRGAFVSQTALRYRIDRRTRSFESFSRNGHDMLVRILDQHRGAPSAAVAEALKLDATDEVWIIDSLSLIDGRPTIAARHCFPAARFPDLLDRYAEAKSISATLLLYGVTSTRNSMRIAADIGEKADLDLLEESWPAAILSIESLYVDQHGVPVDHGLARYAGGRMELELGDQSGLL